jgi:hypothetical protein
MRQDVSRAAATVKAAMGLEPGPELDELIQAALVAESVADLPRWATTLLAHLDRTSDE